jgi:hypothetical protein
VSVKANKAGSFYLGTDTAGVFEGNIVDSDVTITDAQNFSVTHNKGTSKHLHT